MKFTIPLTIFAVAAAVDAAAIAEPEPQWCLRPGQSCWKNKRDASPQWCLRPGQSCWKVKRAADAFADAIQTSGGIEARDEGENAMIAKRQLESLGLALGASHYNPIAYYNSLGFGAHFTPESETSTTEKRDADPQWCLRPGQSCWKAKRDANPQWCLRPGQSCWKAKRDADPQWCLRPGQSCWKAKRAAEAVISSIEGGEQPRSLPFDPEARVKRYADAEAACNTPDGACTYATRDLHAILSVARSIVDTHSK